MIEEVTRYKTLDDNLFKTEKDAETHIIDGVCTEVNELFKANVKTYDLKHRDLVAIFEGLFGDIDKIVALKNILRKYSG